MKPGFPLRVGQDCQAGQFIVFMKVGDFQLPCTYEARKFPLGIDQNCETGQGRFHEGRNFHFSSTYEDTNFLLELSDIVVFYDVSCFLYRNFQANRCFMGFQHYFGFLIRADMCFELM
jgi:hypothetical protein